MTYKKKAGTSFQIDFDLVLDEWEEVVALCDCATFFHTPTWARLLVDLNPAYEIRPVMVRLHEGARILLPLVLTWRSDRSGVCGYESMPLSTYGGPISDLSVDSLTFKEAMTKIGASNELSAYSIIIHGNPYTRFDFPNRYSKQDCVTQIIDLRGGMDVVRKRYAKGAKSALAKAKSAVLFGRYARCLQDWARYYDIYRKSLRRWGDRATSAYDWTLFERLSRIGPNHSRLWLAETDGELCAGAIVFYKFPRLFWWHASADERFFKMRPNNFLQDVIMEDACQQSYTTYDLLQSGGHEGTVKFKRSLGAQRLEFRGCEWRSSWLRRGQHILKAGMSMIRSL
jgi:hypothetical protein